MALQRLHPSLAAIDIPSVEEINKMMAHHVDTFVRDRYRGVKWMRLPLNLSGTASSNAITLGLSKGQIVGPDQGFFWSIRRLSLAGLTAGTTPDTVNLYLNDNFTFPPLWQFNGNNFGYTFAKGALCLMGGETLSLQNVGSIASTSSISLAGELWEAPAEMMAKLL